MSAWRAWWYERSAREQRLLWLAFALAGSVTLTTAALRGRDHFRALEASIEARRHELGTVRRLAAEVEHGRGATPVAAASWVAHVEAAATGIVGRERVAALSPATADDGQRHINLRISDATLAEVVALLYALEGDGGAQRVARLELFTRPGTEARFDVVTEVTTMEAPS